MGSCDPVCDSLIFSTTFLKYFDPMEDNALCVKIILNNNFFVIQLL